VLDAIEARRIPVGAVVGTSSGALAGALWAAGHPAGKVAEILSSRTPFSYMGAHAAVWQGLFSMAPVIETLRALLPPTFADLPRPFAVGVAGPGGRHALLSAGDLPAAVAASCAMPVIFAPVEHGGVRWRDGGAVDRLGLGAWREWRGPRPVIVHRVARSAGVDAADDLGGAILIETPRSGASFWSLGDFGAQRAEARSRALAALGAVAGEEGGVAGETLVSPAL